MGDRIKVRVVATKGSCLISYQVNQNIIFFLNEFPPGFGERGLDESGSGHISIVLSGCFNCRTGDDSFVLEIPHEPARAFVDLTFQKVKFVNPSLRVIALFCGEKEMPLLTVS